MVAPPLFGAVQVTVICVLPAVGLGVGAVGVVLGVPVVFDHSLGPIAFTARTSTL